jgi:hypothetical protein
MRIRINVSITTEDGTLLDCVPLIVDTANEAFASNLIVNHLANKFELHEDDIELDGMGNPIDGGPLK